MYLLEVSVCEVLKIYIRNKKIYWWNLNTSVFQKKVFKK